jgi:hypothetical protein
MKHRLAAVVAAVLLAFPLPALADSFDPLSFGVHAGSLGYGIIVERPLLFDLSARIETGKMTLAQEAAFDGTSFAEHRQYQNVLVALQWRPNGFRFGVSAGLLFGSDHVDYIARNDLGPYIFNGTVYPVAAAGQVTARVSYDHPAIYLGAGTGTGTKRGFALAANVGIVFRNGTSTIVATGPAAGSAALQADLAHVLGQLRTHVISPAVSVGITYRP